MRVIYAFNCVSNVLFGLYTLFETAEITMLNTV